MKNYSEFIKEQYHQHSFILTNDRITEGEYKAMRKKGLGKTEEYLNKNFLGFVKLENQFVKYFFNAVKWQINKKSLLLYYEGFFVNGNYTKVTKFDNVPIENFGSIIKVKTRDSIEKPDIDPFGEEFWFE